VDDVAEAADLLRAERDENTCRKDFTPSEAVAIGEALEQWEHAKAKQRQEAGTNQHTEPSGKLPEASKGQTRDKAAEAVGMSGRTYEKAEAVVEAAAKEPELWLVVEEMDRTGKVDHAFKKVMRIAARPKTTTHCCSCRRRSCLWFRGASHWPSGRRSSTRGLPRRPRLRTGSGRWRPGGGSPGICPCAGRGSVAEPAGTRRLKPPA
jgi:hypothetical protein